MNNFIKRIKEKKYVLIGLTAGLILFTVPVVWLVDDFIRVIILVPIAYYIWLGNIILSALPQSCFLLLLVILSILIMLPSLRRGRTRIWTAQPSPEIVEGQVAIWEQRLHLLKRGRYSDNRFAYHLGHLVVQILAYEERISIRDVINALESGAFDIPDQVRQYILIGIGMGNAPPKRTLKQRIHQLWKQISPTQQTLLIDKQYAEIIPVLEYIETKLQMQIRTDVEQFTEPDTSKPEVSYVN